MDDKPPEPVAATEEPPVPVASLARYRKANERGIAPGDVVQIDPNKSSRFGGCFMQVTSIQPFGVEGFVKIPTAGRAPFVAEFHTIRRIGRAEWVSE